MIEGKSKLIFGTGDIMMTPVLNKIDNEKTGWLVFENNFEGHKIGEYTGQNSEFKIAGKDVLMVFNKIESLEVVLERLNLLKSMWLNQEDDLLELDVVETANDFKV